jgi:hypothetical protein
MTLTRGWELVRGCAKTAGGVPAANLSMRRVEKDTQASACTCGRVFE